MNNDDREYTPENITELKQNEIFVFGSNESGIHGAGAAKVAIDKFNAVFGQGVGLQGQSYAIPTKDKRLDILPLYRIYDYILDFLTFAEDNPQLKFYVTKIGCGLAGYHPRDIKKVFYDVGISNNIILPIEFTDDTE